MDEGKILIVNLSKGLIGEDNAAILGSFLVTKIQLAAMSRSDIERIEDRRPFYLYVDEFQNFATDSFATILSEARKYGLNLTVANQYISQMSETVRDAVFGNVGTVICFRVSADDAPILAKQFEPQFEAVDLLQMHNRNFIINMVIKGEKSPAFNATTLTLPPAQTDNTALIIENTRRNYSRNRSDVEVEIAEAIAPPENLQKPQPKPQQPAQAKVQAPQPKAITTPQTQHQQPKPIQQAQQPKQSFIKWPADAQHIQKLAENSDKQTTDKPIEKGTSHPAPVATDTEQPKPKRRRPRNRKRKTSPEAQASQGHPEANASPAHTSQKPAVKSADDMLKIRH